jgi:hypothetical protein
MKCCKVAEACIGLLLVWGSKMEVGFELRRFSDERRWHRDN